MKPFLTGVEATPPVQGDLQQPLLDRQVSRQSYGSTSSPGRAKNGSTTERARSKRRRTRIQSSVYTDPPGEYLWALTSSNSRCNLSHLALSAVLLCLLDRIADL